MTTNENPWTGPVFDVVLENEQHERHTVRVDAPTTRVAMLTATTNEPGHIAVGTRLVRI